MPEPAAVISDATCLIALTNIGELEILQQLYIEVITTPEVQQEYGLPLPAWIKVLSPHDKKFQQFVETVLDNGEASAIALAVETSNCLLILDEDKARKFAQQLGLAYTGTLGVIVKAKNQGLVSAIRPLIEKLKSVNFRLSEKVEKEILKRAGE